MLGQLKHESDASQLPSFIAVGPQRTATTWLYAVLQNHMQFPEGVKETRFFDLEYHKGMSWYESHFSENPNRIIGEIAPTYFHLRECATRIKKEIPNCKIICSLRNPVDRSFSLYRLLREYGLTKLSFEEAFEQLPEFRETNSYADCVKMWFDVFGKENVLVIFYDDLKIDQQSYLNSVTDFIGAMRIDLRQHQMSAPDKEGVARNDFLAKCATHIGWWLRSRKLYGIVNFAKSIGLKSLLFSSDKELPPMSSLTRNNLIEHFRDEIERVEKLLGRDLSQWRT